MITLDVRKPSEYSAGHVSEAVSFPLDFINDKMDELEKGEKYHIHCAGGYRSVIAASILKARGFDQLVDIAGGYGAISKTEIPSASETV